MNVLASGPFLDWEEMTGLSKFWIDLISIPLFSVVAGVFVNWTGVKMMFAPTDFTGFYVPGLLTVFPFLPRKLQVLPMWAPGGIMGFQGIIPARAEKMACFTVDKAISKIGSVEDFYREFEPEVVAAHMNKLVQKDIRAMVTAVMAREHPQLWRDMTPNVREKLFDAMEAELPAISARALDKVGKNVSQMVDIRMMAISLLAEQPAVLKNVIWKIAAPELKFMVRIGLLGLPFGIIFALLIHYYAKVPVIQHIPAWIVVIAGAMIIGVTVNLLAVKIVFEPATPQPRYRYLWKQARLAKRQHTAALDFGDMLANDVLTSDNVANEILNGARGDRTRGFFEAMISEEIDRVLGPTKTVVRAAVGGREFDAIKAASFSTTLEYTPSVLDADPEFVNAQKAKLQAYAVERLRKLPPKDFMEMIYSVIEQDAWVLYWHGATLGIMVGGLHLLVFGA